MLICIRILFKDQYNILIKVITNNVTVVSYTINMSGNHSQLCNNIASQMLTLSIDKTCTCSNICLKAALILRVDNVVADRKSKIVDDQTELRFNSNVL